MRQFIFIALLASVSTLGYAGTFSLSSPEIKPHHQMSTKFEFNGFGCTGKNISPALQWRGAPKGTKSFALTVYDPDAPTGSGWWHWVVVNIPTSVHSLPANAGALHSKTLPAGSMQLSTDYGSAAYGGPCPPKGDKPHHYIFSLYALKTDKLNLPAKATAALAGYMIHMNMLAEARFTARFGRAK